MSIQKLIKSIVFSLAILAFFINLINISYTVNYYARYNESNVKMISDFRLFQEKHSESEFNELCSKIQPANFMEVYGTLANWSGAMLKILAITILAYLIYSFIYLLINKEKRNEKINFEKTVFVLLLFFMVSGIFYWFSIDTEYDILYCSFPFMQSY